jgi:hypothetical protein
LAVREPGRHLGGMAGGKVGVWRDLNLQQQTRHVRPGDPLRGNLRRMDLAVNRGHCQQIGRLWSASSFVWTCVGPEPPAAGEVVGVLGDLRLDACDRGGIKWVSRRSSSMQKMADWVGTALLSLLSASWSKQSSCTRSQST